MFATDPSLVHRVGALLGASPGVPARRASDVRALRQQTLDAATPPDPKDSAPPTRTSETANRGIDQPALTRSPHTERLTDPLSHPA